MLRQKKELVCCTVLWFLVWLAAMPLAGAAKLGVWGRMETRIVYKPETLWQPYYLLRLYSDTVIQDQGHLLLRINASGSDQKKYLNQQEGFRLDFSRFELTNITARGPLWQGGPSLNLGMGALLLNYSSLVLKMDSDYSPWGRGLLCEGLTLGRLGTVDGALLWENGNYERDYLWRWQKKLSLVGSKELALKMVGITSQPREAAQVPREKAYDLEAKYLLPAGGFVTGNYAWQSRENDREKQVIGVSLLSWQIPLADLGLWKGKYWDFPSGFDPRFRNRRPKYDDNQGKYLGGNPVDDYAGEKGFEVGWAQKWGEYQLGASFQQYRNQEDEEKNRRLTFELVTTLGKTGIAWNGYCEERIRSNANGSNVALLYFNRLTLRRSLLSPSLGRLALEYVYSDWRPDKALLVDHASHTLRLSTTLLKGPLRLAKLSGGVEVAKEENQWRNYRFIAMEQTLPNGLALTIRYSIPNREGLDRYDPVREEYLPEDNLLELRANVNF